jgi:septal ring factor EnvC (AmiA/AmiB activator)
MMRCTVLSERESKKNPTKIKESLDDIVHKLEQDSSSSTSWGDYVASNKEDWEHIKSQIHERQRALKQLVMDKKAGLVGIDEFEKKYRKLQDELAELEIAVYNRRLGTNVK